MIAAEWPSVVGALAAVVSVVFAGVSVYYAARSSSKNDEAAENARRALAIVRFPTLRHHIYQQIVDADDMTTPMSRWYLTVWNASRWDAIDVEAEVRLRDQRMRTGRAARLHPAPHSPPERTDEQLVVEMPNMPSDNTAGYGQVVSTVVRWSDAHRIARWEARRDWNGTYTPPFTDALSQIGGPSVTTD